MKIVVFGLTLSSSWGNGHATLWRGLCKNLIAQGNRVTFFERDVRYYAEHRDLDHLKEGDLILYPDWETIRPQAQREVDAADVTIVTSYCPDALLAGEMMLWSSSLRVFYDLDAPVTIARLEEGRPVTYVSERGYRDFDLVLSYTGGETLELLQERLGAQRVAPLYGSVDPDVHYPVAPVSDYVCDLSYLGTYAADRQETLERLFVEPARRCPAKKFLIGGALYPEVFPWTENTAFVRHVPPGEHPAFFSSSRFTLNVTRQAMAQIGYCPSGRLFEAAACGTPLISDHWPGLDSFFAPGDEVLVAETPEAVIEALGMYESERLSIGKNAHERTLAEHSAARRAKEMEQLFESAFSNQPKG